MCKLLQHAARGGQRKLPATMMKANFIRAAIAAALLLALASTARADTSEIRLRGALTSGGGTITAGGYTITSSIGQPLVGIARSGEYVLSSGMPFSTSAAQRDIYLPLTVR